MSPAERIAKRIPAPWRSRCWYYPALYALSFLYLTVVAQVFAPFIPEAITPLTKLLSVIAAFTYLFAFPFLAISLFVDASGAIIDSDGWEPNPYLYGIVGLAPAIASTDVLRAAGKTFVGLGAASAPFVAFGVCVVYLVQRHRHMGTP